MNVIQVRVIPNARQNKIVDEGERLKVYLTVPPADGRANKALIAFLSGHFGVKKSGVSIVKGEKSRDKVIRIEQ